MQMSLEAITMLMRFHHRSCCSGIRSIFHPYLENNCIFKIRTNFQCSQLSLYKIFLKRYPQQTRVPDLSRGDVLTGDSNNLFVAFPSCSSVKSYFVFRCVVLLITSKNPVVDNLLAAVSLWGEGGGT